MSFGGTLGADEMTRMQALGGDENVKPVSDRSGSWRRSRNAANLARAGTGREHFALFRTPDDT